MTDQQHGDLLDLAKHAIRLERIEGDQRALTQQLKTSLDSFNAAFASLQSESKMLVEKVSGLATLQTAHDSNKLAIDEIKKGVGSLDEKIGKLFTDLDEKNNRRWERYEANRDEWRLRHEAENEDSFRTLTQDVRSVRETVIRTIGIGIGAGMLAGTVAGGFIWSLNTRFDSAYGAIGNNSKTLQYHQQLLDTRRERMHEIELYLAAGGVDKQQPYRSTQQGGTKNAE